MSQTDPLTRQKLAQIMAAAAAGGGHTDEEICDLVGAMVSGNTETGIAVTYQDADNTLDFEITKGALTGTSPVTMSAARETIGGAVAVSIVNDAAAAITQFDTATLIADDDTIIPTAKQLAKALMIGSGNSAWVPCAFEIEDYVGKVKLSLAISNVDGQDLILLFRCPLPTNRGGLKLYVKGVRVCLMDADATDYVSRCVTAGCENDAAPVFATLNDQNPPNPAWTSIAVWTEAYAAVDCSSYCAVVVSLTCVCATAGDLDIGDVSLDCYYAS